MPLEKKLLNSDLCNFNFLNKFALFSYYFLFWLDRIQILFCNWFLYCFFWLHILLIFDVFKTRKSPWSTSVMCLRLHDPGVQIRATMIQLRVVYLLYFLRTINILYFLNFHVVSSFTLWCLTTNFHLIFDFQFENFTINTFWTLFF